MHLPDTRWALVLLSLICTWSLNPKAETCGLASGLNEDFSWWESELQAQPCGSSPPGGCPPHRVVRETVTWWALSFADSQFPRAPARATGGPSSLNLLTYAPPLPLRPTLRAPAFECAFSKYSRAFSACRVSPAPVLSYTAFGGSLEHCSSSRLSHVVTTGTYPCVSCLLLPGIRL